ncbi:MAG TPA: alpha/beta fold hydrolase [Patescibacteria group bacterium]|nr:alpha/beta fold hydrolase [Patescibacteria group bacterium]
MVRLLKEFIELLFELILILVYFPVGFVNGLYLQFITPLLKKDKGTIVLVERWFHSHILHNKWKRYLEKQGFRVYMINFPIYKGGFSDSAFSLKTFIDAQNLRDITLVGISSGGLTSYLYLQDHDGWKRVKQFISVGTPFGGTYTILPLFFLKSARELFPSSSFINTLQKNPLLDPKKVTCLSAKFDGLIPTQHCFLPGAENITIDVYGHNNLHLRCRQTYDIIVSKAVA